MSVEAPRKMLHSKRSFGKYPKGVDSPAYDASEEDNDPLTDDAASAMSIPVIVPRQQPPPAAGPSAAPSSGLPSRVHTRPSFTSRPKHHLAASLLSDSDGVDSPTYDGDVESSATAGADTQSFKVSHHPTSSTSTLGTPVTPNFPALSTHSTPGNGNDDHDLGDVGDEHRQDVKPIPARSQSMSSAGSPAEPSSATLALTGVNTRELTIEEIQAFVRRAIEGEPWRPYKINKPPTDRPVRIYADGVYDLFHFGHALQLRQAKLSFPSVYLLVGVNTDEDVKAHKAQGIMPHAERVESVRHCKWVDEVVLEAPWVINEAFLQKYHIDYVAHDESPYASAGSDDVYGYVKSQGKFLPTRRTAGISTSDLLERIVSGYRKRDFDDKLTKMGHAELRAEGSDYDSLNSSRQASRRVSRSASVQDNLGKIDQNQ